MSPFWLLFLVSAAATLDVPGDGGDAREAQVAAESAKQAAKVANKVATHSIRITEHAQTALSKARNALQNARVDSQGLSNTQRDMLKDADSHLREAEQTAAYGKMKVHRAADGSAVDEGQGRDELEARLGKLQDRLESKGSASTSAIAGMRKELRELREQLAMKRRYHESLKA